MLNEDVSNCLAAKHASPCHYPYCHLVLALDNAFFNTKLMHQCHSLHAAPGGDRLPCNISGAAFCQDSGMSLVHYTIRQLQLLVGTLSLKIFPVMSPRAFGKS